MLYMNTPNRVVVHIT